MIFIEQDTRDLCCYYQIKKYSFLNKILVEKETFTRDKKI